MPQLYPNPWFTILIYAWLVLLAIVPLKVLSYVYPNHNYLRGLEKPEGHSWFWPWL
nr:ATP synthase protein 8 [Morone chrysops]